MDVAQKIDGVAIGILLGFEDGAPKVVFPSNREDGAALARSLVTLGKDDVGHEVALLFEDGSLSRPLIIGRIIDHPRAEPTPEVIRDGETVRIHGKERIEMRCGKASIIMEKDGHITIRGTYLVSHASAANRIRGGSVNLN